MIPLGSVFAFEVELLSVMHALVLAEKFNCNHLWVECESTYVVGLFGSEFSRVPWLHQARWSSCIRFVESYFFHISPIYSESNQVTHILSKFAISVMWISGRLRYWFFVQQLIRMMSWWARLLLRSLGFASLFFSFPLFGFRDGFFYLYFTWYCFSCQMFFLQGFFFKQVLTRPGSLRLLELTSC